jgi:hypothetical protein
MSPFYVAEAKAALATFEELARQNPVLYHALLMSPQAKAMGEWTVMDLNSVEDRPYSDEEGCAKQRALTIIDRALFMPFKSGDGLTHHPTVIARNTVFVSGVLSGAANSGRSVLASLQPNAVRPVLDKLTDTSRRAYVATRELLSSTPWDLFRWEDARIEGHQTDHAHLWLSGLELWAASEARRIVACNRDFVKRSGKTYYHCEDTGFQPQMRIDTTMETESDRPYIRFGNYFITAPEDRQVADELFGVTEDAVWFRIEADCCATSATALRWVIAKAEEVRLADTNGRPSSSVTNVSKIDVPVRTDGDTTPTHSYEFTSVDWYGTRYKFSKGNQAQTVRVLWEIWEHGEHSLSQETIGERIDSSADRFEMRKTFRQRKSDGRGYVPHPAWGTMIQDDGKGCYRLARPKSD